MCDRIRLRRVALFGGLWLGLSSLMATAGPAPELRKLHALLVVDTLSGLEESVEQDGERVERLLRGGLPPGRMEVRILKGKEVRAENILAYYRGMKAGPEDALLFYYAGHGATDAEEGHYLALQEAKVAPLLRSDLRRAMQAPRPALAVILTDCCGNRYNLPGKRRKVGAEGVAGELDPVLRDLLFRSRGLVDVTAASGNAAFGDDHDGGLFTRTLDRLVRAGASSLDADADGFVSWQEFFPRLRAETEQTFVTWSRRQRDLGSATAQTSQRPFAYDLASGGAPIAAAVRLRNQTAEPVEYQFRWSRQSPWEDGRIAPHGTAEHVPPGSPGVTPSPSLEVRFKGGKTANLRPGKSYRFHDPDAEQKPTKGP